MPLMALMDREVGPRIGEKLTLLAVAHGTAVGRGGPGSGSGIGRRQKVPGTVPVAAAGGLYEYVCVHTYTHAHTCYTPRDLIVL